MSDLIGGVYPKKRHENTPDYVLGKFSINVEQFREWMQSYLKENPEKEWVNIEMKLSRGDKPYAVLDTWEPNSEGKPTEPAPKAEEFNDDDIPF